MYLWELCTKPSILNANSYYNGWYRAILSEAMETISNFRGEVFV